LGFRVSPPRTLFVVYMDHSGGESGTPQRVSLYPGKISPSPEVQGRQKEHRRKFPQIESPPSDHLTGPLRWPSWVFPTIVEHKPFSVRLGDRHGQVLDRPDSEDSFSSLDSRVSLATPLRRWSSSVNSSDHVHKLAPTKFLFPSHTLCEGPKPAPHIVVTSLPPLRRR